MRVSLMNTSLTPVLNVEEEILVMIPLDNAIVLKQGAVYPLEDMPVMGICDEDYRELQSAMGGLREANYNDIKYFVEKKISNLELEQVAELSKKVFEWIENTLESVDFSLSLLMKHNNVPYWATGILDAVVEKFEIAIEGMTMESKYNAVIEALNTTASKAAA